VAPFIAGYASLVAVSRLIRTAPAAAQQELVSSDRKPKLGQTGAGTTCLPSPTSQVTRCSGGVEHAKPLEVLVALVRR
jgi:hypothetical protein